MRLILVRHGNPNYEQDCLTELGHKQAKVVAKRLMEEGIEEIFVSPMGRAKQTAEAFADLSGIGQMKVLDFMHEIRYGREGALYQDLNPWLSAFDLIRQGKNLQSPDWRKYPEFIDNTATIDADKVMAAADEWLETLGYKREGLYYRCMANAYNERTVALFSHGGSSTAFMSRVLNIPFPHLVAVLGHLGHTSITILSFDPTPGNLTMPILEVAADARHLKDVR